MALLTQVSAAVKQLKTKKSSFFSDFTTPVHLFYELKESYPYALFYESVDQSESWGRFSFVALGSSLAVWGSEGAYQLKIGSKTEKMFETNPCRILDELLAEIEPDLALPALGYFGYPISRHFEKLPQRLKDETGVAETHFVFPEVLCTFDHSAQTFLIQAWGTNTTELDQKIEAVLSHWKVLSKKDRELLPNPFFSAGKHEVPLPDYKSNTSFDEFCAMVEKAKEYILAGDIFQVVLSQRFELDYSADPFLFYRYLRVLNPSPYLFYLQFPQYTISGSSPEVMVKKEGQDLTLRPIAGSKPRGKTTTEDLALNKALLEDQKELAEHHMLVDLGRNDLGRISDFHSVKVVKLLHIENYSHIKHLVTTLTSKAMEGLSYENLFRAVFPAGTLSGAPKIRAMEIIDELEKSARSFYGGAVWFQQGQNFNSCIGIRSAIFHQGKAFVQAGAGIVADSVPETEYQESVNKAKAILGALGLALLQ